MTGVVDNTKREMPIFGGVLATKMEMVKPVLTGLENGLYSTMQSAINLTNNSKLPNLNELRPLKTFEDLIGNYFVRAHVYEEEGYGDEFKSKGGLDFDEFDPYSVSFGCYKDNNLVGSVRIVMDNSEVGLPSDKYCSEVSHARSKFKIVEGSRMVVLPEFQKVAPRIVLSLLMACREFSKLNGIERVLYSGAEHIYNMYQKSLAPQEIHSSDVNYGALSQRIICASWNPFQTYPKFDKMYLRGSRAE